MSVLSIFYAAQPTGGISIIFVERDTSDDVVGQGKTYFLNTKQTEDHLRRIASELGLEIILKYDESKL